MKTMRFWKKKDKGPYPRSFAKRLTWRIMLMLLIVMGVISALIFGSGFLAIYTFGELLLPQMIDSRTETIAGKLSEVSVAAVNTVPDIEENISHPDMMYGFMERLVSLNPHVRSCGISFVDNYYPGKGRWYCPYTVRKDSATIERQTLGGKDYDYLTAEWFTKTIAADSASWSKAFFAHSDTTKTPLVAYMIPIHDKQGKAVAVLGLDVSLDEVLSEKQGGLDEADDKKPWSAKKEVYSFTIDSEGTYLRHPDRKRVINENFLKRCEATADTLDDQVVKAMLKVDTTNYAFENAKVLNLEGEEVMLFYVPIKHTNWTLALVVPEFFIDLFGYIFGGFLLFFILIGLVVVFFAGRRGIKKTSKPLKQLAASADEVAKGNFDTVLPDIQSRDEIHQLRDSFDNMQRSLTRYVGELRETTAQKASMESELKIAHDIQMAMVPKIFPPYPNRDDIDIYGMMVPAKSVGGDLFDFLLRDERLFFCIGDVSGKGVPASLFMAVTRSLFRSVAAEELNPQQIMTRINASLCDGNNVGMFVTMFIGVLDLQTGRLDYCNGGHEAPLVFGETFDRLPVVPNLAVGILDDKQFEVQSTTLAPQTTLLLFTDGLTEALNTDDKLFDMNRVMQVGRELQADGLTHPLEVTERMRAAVEAFVGEANQSDDLTMLAVQYKPKKG